MSFIARGKHLEAIRAKGLTIRSPLGDATLKVKASENPADLGEADVVLFAVKLWDTESAAERIRPLVEKGGVVIPFQNGVESIARIGKVLGAQRVMGGARPTSPRASATGPHRADRPHGAPALRDHAAVAAQSCGSVPGRLQDAKIDAELADDIVRVQWEKFVFLVAISSDDRGDAQDDRRGAHRPGPALAARDRDARNLVARQEARCRAGGRPRREDARPGRQLHPGHARLAGRRPRGRRPAGSALALRRGGAHGARCRLEATVNRTIYAALKPYVNGR